MQAVIDHFVAHFLRGKVLGEYTELAVFVFHISGDGGRRPEGPVMTPEMLVLLSTLEVVLSHLVLPAVPDIWIVSEHRLNQMECGVEGDGRYPFRVIGEVFHQVGQGLLIAFHYGQMSALSWQGCIPENQ